MTNPTRHRRLLSRYGRAASVALALAAIFVLSAVAPQSAQAQKFELFYQFEGPPDGNWPAAALTRDTNGNFYGTTLEGGAYTCPFYSGCGTVFKVDNSGTETVLYSFCSEGCLDGALPEASLVRDAAGNLYGTTLQGGDQSCDCGTVFKLNMAGKETVLHAFTGNPDGESPSSGLVMDAAGNLYGTTLFGGSASRGNGVVFKLDPSGTETILHSFVGYPSDGERPYASLVQDTAGNLYGTTYFGGVSGALEPSSNWIQAAISRYFTTSSGHQTARNPRPVS